MSIAVAIGAGVWLGIGVALSVVMWRRGYDGWAWLIIGVFMGPLAVAPAIASRRDPRPRYALPDDIGLVDVLVGFDGSPESRTALATATSIFGARLGRLTVATAVPIDIAPLGERTATAALDDAVASLAPTAAKELVRGLPAEALSACAQQAGYDVVVVGTRGAGFSKHLLGSVATQLSHASKVPVLLVPSAA